MDSRYVTGSILILCLKLYFGSTSFQCFNLIMHELWIISCTSNERREIELFIHVYLIKEIINYDRKNLIWYPFFSGTLCTITPCQWSNLLPSYPFNAFDHLTMTPLPCSPSFLGLCFMVPYLTSPKPVVTKVEGQRAAAPPTPPGQRSLVIWLTHRL